MQLIIGNKRYSSWSLRPWLLMRHFDLPFDEIMVNLYQGDTRAERLAYSPTGKVPALIDDGALVWESLALLDYLAERFPQLPLWPAERIARAHARSIAAEMHAGFGALRQAMPTNFCARLPGRGHTDAALADVARVVELGSDCRTRFGGTGRFLFGEFGIADAMYAPVATRLVTYGVQLPPLVRDWVDALYALPAMNEWLQAAESEPLIRSAEPYADA